MIKRVFPHPKPSLFNALKRIGALEQGLKEAVGHVRSLEEGRVLSFVRTLGAIWGIGAFLALFAILIHG